MTAPTRTHRPGWTLAAVAVVSILVAGLLAVAAGGGPGDHGSQGKRLAEDGPASGTLSSRQAAVLADIDPASFLSTYVTGEGRVTRLDQGGDTVSEGQAYAMLIAADAGREDDFERVWSWTQANLMRPDGLLSWRWVDGTVDDPAPASDADLDAARALLVAARRFDEPSYRRDAMVLGRAILEHETVQVPSGRVLVAGPWAIEGRADGPWVFNPSYVSPVATTMLAEASGDPRWAEVEAGSRAAIRALVGPDRLPPDWAEIDSEGRVRAVPSPSGAPVQFGYDAARTIVRNAESCEPSDQRIAADAAGLLGPGPAVAVYYLDGRSQTTNTSPLTMVAQAAAQAAAGRDSAAVAALERTSVVRRDAPSYYGDAWAVLGPMLIMGDDLGGCAPLETR